MHVLSNSRFKCILSFPLWLPYTRGVSSPLPHGPDSLVCAVETVLAERCGVLRRRAHHLGRPRALSSVSFRDEAVDSSPLGHGRARRHASEEAPRPQRLVSTPRGHRILVVADDTQVRLAAARELCPRFDLLHAVSFTSAARKLEAGEPFSGLVMDLGLNDERGASWFLARLVDHAFEGPRILLSGAIPREQASSLSQSCQTHFALARPWRGGELRALLETALGPLTRDFAPGV